MEEKRRKAKSEAERQHLTEATGIDNPEILEKFQELGYIHETAMLLYLAPLAQVAWVDGHVNIQEREKFFDIARLSGIKPGSPAYRQLADWLDHRPSEGFFQESLRLIRNILRAMPTEKRNAVRQDLTSCCAWMAAASGGIFEGRPKTSDVERVLVTQIADALK